MGLNKSDLLLYAVTDRSWLGGHTLYQDVEAAIKGGATFIQLLFPKKQKKSRSFAKNIGFLL